MSLKYFFFVLLLCGCAHKNMDQTRAEKLCRKIFGPEQKRPQPLPLALTKLNQSAQEIVRGCYQDYVASSKDPRDYVSCTMLTLDPRGGKRLTILSTQEFLLPEIVLQCAQTNFSKLKTLYRPKNILRLENVFHHITVTKN